MFTLTALLCLIQQVCVFLNGRTKATESKHNWKRMQLNSNTVWEQIIMLPLLTCKYYFLNGDAGFLESLGD